MICANFFMTYIVPVLLVLGLAGLFAFALSFLGLKLKADKDERLEVIRENLSGANCGGCGYAGCDAFAEALFKGETTLEKCRPTKGPARERIAKIIGIKVKPSEPKIACVSCNGGIDCKDKGGYQGYGDCESSNMLAGGNKECEVGCMGLGSCVRVCQYDAITVDEDKNVAVVDPGKCVYCGACIKKCPKNLIGGVPMSAKVYVACSNKCAGKIAKSQCQRACIACTLCAKACPSGAIKIVENLARIDYKKCTSCGKCVEVCPQKCILRR